MVSEQGPVLSVAAATDCRNPIDAAPKLSSRGLSLMLVLMCLVPVATVAFFFMTPTKNEQLKASVTAQNLPAPEVFRQPLGKRKPPELPPSLIVKNEGDQEWSLVFVRINKWFEYSETRHPIPPGGQIEVLLHRCRGKDGTPHNPIVQPLKHVQVFARLPEGYRATYSQEFDHTY